METTLTAVKITSDVAVCACCRREGLKRTVLLSDGLYYGTQCAATLMFGKPTHSKKVIDQATSIMRARKTVEVLSGVKRDRFQQVRFDAAVAYLLNNKLLSRDEVKALY